MSLRIWELCFKSTNVILGHTCLGVSYGVQLHQSSQQAVSHRHCHSSALLCSILDQAAWYLPQKGCRELLGVTLQLAVKGLSPHEQREIE